MNTDCKFHKIIIFTLISSTIFTFMSCNKNSEYKALTNAEKKLINDNDASSHFEVLKITNEQDSVFLRSKSIDIDPEELTTPDFKLLIDRMHATLLKENGVGLAAPQIGIGRNIFLFMNIAGNKDIITAINPKIINTPENFIAFEGDGCLSIPNEGGTTKRFEWVEVEYLKPEGDLVRQKLKGGSRLEDFTGIIFQHEFDHLQGVLFTDKLWD